MKRVLILISALLFSSSLYSQEVTREEFNRLSNDIENLKLLKQLDYFSFGGSLETRYDYVDIHSTDSSNFNLYRLRAKFDIAANPSDDFEFYGRLAMTKYFNNGSGQNFQTIGTGYSDFYQGQTPLDSSVYFERAFINWHITNKFTLTAGRLPTINGSPYHFKIGESNKGSYPILGYNAIIDGLALSYKPIQELTVRGIFTPVYNPGYSYLTSPSSSALTRLEDLDADSELYSLMLDYEKYNMSLAQRINIVLQGLYAKDFLITNNAAIPGYSSDLEFDILRFVLLGDFSHLFNSGFNLSLQVSYTETKSRGLFTTPAGSVGFLTNKDEDSKDGFAFLGSIQYDFEKKYVPIIGYELFLNSKNSNYTVGDYTYDPLNMLETVGDAHHVYTLFQLNDYLKFRLGYIYQNRKYSQNPIGERVRIDDYAHNIYSLLYASF